MPMRLLSWLRRPLLLRSLLVQIRLAARLLREPRVPAVLKIIPLAALGYLIAPADLVPDLLPVLGQMDDIGVILGALELFRRLCPSNAELFHRAAILAGRRYSPMPSADDVIEAEWRRE